MDTTEWLEDSQSARPLGVVGIVYESRPNVTVDAAVLAFKTGNAVVSARRQGSCHSNQVLAEILAGFPGVPSGAIELLDSSTRETVQELITARGLVDVIVPRGGPALITHVVENAWCLQSKPAREIVISLLMRSADLEMASRITINARLSVRRCVMRRKNWWCIARSRKDSFRRSQRATCRCGRRTPRRRGVAPTGVGRCARKRTGLGRGILATVHGDSRRRQRGRSHQHINQYSTKHSETIVTADEKNARKFLQLVDSAAVYWNASTRFTDGGEFGFGAEMGVSTQKLHCRGPFALRELTSSKYQIVGTGQVR